MSFFPPPSLAPLVTPTPYSASLVRGTVEMGSKGQVMFPTSWTPSPPAVKREEQSLDQCPTNEGKDHDPTHWIGCSPRPSHILERSTAQSWLT